VYLCAVLAMSAEIKLVIVRVVLLLLPPMAVEALELIRASIFVAAYELPRSPIYALLLRIKIELRLSSVVLPVVGIDTGVSYVLSFVVWAPYTLKVKHVEIKIFVKLVYELD